MSTSPGSLTLRVASGVVLVPLLLAVAFVGGDLYYATVTLVAVIAAWEVRGMMRASGRTPVDPILVGLAGFLPLDAWWFRSADPAAQSVIAPHGGIALAVAVIGSLLLLMLRRDQEGALLDWAVSLSLGLYIGALMQFFIPLRSQPDGAFWVMLLLVLSWVCDSTAYFVGRAWGRIRLAPRISPKKSVEGALAGLGACLLVAIITGVATGHSLPLLAGYGVAIGAATIYGDLAESFVKRQTGVKDSSSLVPGHGGLLDRMDSLLYCGPVAVLYLLAFAA